MRHYENAKKRYPKDGTTKIERDRNGSALKKGLQQAKLNFSHSRNKLLHVERPFPPFFFILARFWDGAYFPSIAFYFEFLCNNCPSLNATFLTKATFAQNYERDFFRLFIAGLCAPSSTSLSGKGFRG